MTPIKLRQILSLLLMLGFVIPNLAQSDSPSFTKQILTGNYYCDGVSAGDFNKDGHQDVVAGPFWYAGPSFTKANAFYPPKVHPTEPSPTDSMFSFVYDFNRDGWDDILVCGRVHKHQAFWYENPKGKSGNWQKHFVFERVQGESPALIDINQDGHPEILCLWKKQWGWIAPDKNNPKQPWTFHAVTPKGDWHHFYHGMGVGDVNSDGRLDLLLNDGWWEQPPPSENNKFWTEHSHRFAKKGGAQMFAYDVDNDGDNDIISSLDAHGWGLAWFEHSKVNGVIGFKRHTIMGSRTEETTYGAAFSQPHALELADMNGDGALDIITGKRRWAHGPKGDVEPNAAPVVYWFELQRSSRSTPQFKPHLVDNASGVGVQITVKDVNNDGKQDILAASKLGTFVFRNK